MSQSRGRQAVDRFEWAMANSAIGMMLVAADGSFLGVNQALCTMLGRDESALMQSTWRELTHPDDLDTDVALTEETLAGKRDTYRLLKRYLHADGSVIWGDLFVACVRTAEGSVDYFVSQIVDMTEQVQLREHYALLAENATDVVYLMAPDRTLRWMSPNTESSLGWSADDLVGTVLVDLVHPEDHDALQKARERVYTGGDFADPDAGHVARIRAKDGSYLWMSIKTTTVVDDKGMMMSAVVTMRNVNDLVLARMSAENDEELLRVTMGAVLDPLVLVKSVRDVSGSVVDFVYVDVNDAACEYLTMSREQLMGSRMLDTLPGIDSSGLLAIYARAVDQVTPTVMDDFQYNNELLGEPRYYDIRARGVSQDRLSLTWRDVTERHESAARIADSERQFRTLAQNASDVVLRATGDCMEWVSPSLTRMLGWSFEQWVGHSLEEFMHPDDIVQSHSHLLRVVSGATVITRLRLRDSEGDYHWVEIHAGPAPDDSGDTAAFVASFRTIDNVVEFEAELLRRARYDDLTGALKRDEVLRRLVETGGSRRQPGSHSAVLFCDLDGFKAINDRLGHAAGDAVLKSVVDRIRVTVREGDSVGRTGGDEFLVILDGVHDLGDAFTVAEKVRQAVVAPLQVGSEIVKVGMSIGVTLQSPGEDADELIARADRAMYDAKRKGRGNVVTVPPPT